MSVGRGAAIGAGLAALLTLSLGLIEAPSVAAGGLLYPRRLGLYSALPSGCVEREFSGEDGVALRGWLCRAVAPRRGSVVYLHGVADNRSSAAGIIPGLTRRGFDVIAYDSRAHGLSDGTICTYGFYEKADLRRVIDGLDPGPVVLIGNSLGAAVALQGAVGNERIAGVVAAEAFSDLKTIATERAPRYVPSWTIQQAFRVAEQRGRFVVSSVSPLDAARSLRIPVLLIHGAQDHDTSPDHSRRLLAALAGPKQLILVRNAAHSQSMSGAGVWAEIERWLDHVVPPAVTQ